MSPSKALIRISSRRSLNRSAANSIRAYRPPGGWLWRKRIAGLPGFGHGLAESDRDEVLARLLPSFPTLEDQFGLDVLQAISPNNVVIARAQDPQRFGDDMSKTRPMVVQANVSGQPQNGLEIGSMGLRVRAVVPVIQAGKKLGLFEVGQRVDRLLENLRLSSGADVALLLNADVARDLERAPSEPPRQGLGDLIGDVGTNWQLFTEIAKHIYFAQVKDPTFDLVSLGDHSYAIMQVAFSDYDGQPMGNFVAIKDADDALHYRRVVLLEIMVVAAVGAVAITCLILVMFRGLLLGPVAAAAALAEALSEGKTPPPLPNRKGRDSVSRLFAALERLRGRKQAEPGEGASS